jgi:hypothetical protein
LAGSRISNPNSNRSRGAIEALSSLSHPTINWGYWGPYPRKAPGSSPVARPMHWSFRQLGIDL